MNYIELINLFWQTRRRVRLSSVEADLYFFLLQECNTQNWENPFECPNGLICVSIGMSEPTLIDARNRLQQKGFIEFVKGKRRAQSPVYTLLNLNNFSKNFSKTFSKSFSKNFSKTHSKTADTPLIGEKQKQKQPPISPPKSEDAELPFGNSENGNSGKPNIPGKPEIEEIVRLQRHLPIAASRKNTYRQAAGGRICPAPRARPGSCFRRDPGRRPVVVSRRTEYSRMDGRLRLDFQTGKLRESFRGKIRKQRKIATVWKRKQ